MPKRVVPVRVRPWALIGGAATRGMGFAKTLRSRGRKSCHQYLGIGHAGSLAIAIRLEIQRISREAWSGTGPVVETRRVHVSAGPSTLTVACESPIRWPKKSFAT